MTDGRQRSAQGWSRANAPRLSRQSCRGPACRSSSVGCVRRFTGDWGLDSARGSAAASRNAANAHLTSIPGAIDKLDGVVVVDAYHRAIQPGRGHDLGAEREIAGALKIFRLLAIALFAGATAETRRERAGYDHEDDAPKGTSRLRFHNSKGPEATSARLVGVGDDWRALGPRSPDDRSRRIRRVDQRRTRCDPGGVRPRCAQATAVATRRRGVRSSIRLRTRNGSATSSTVSTSSPTATASVPTPTGPPDRSGARRASRTARSSRSKTELDQRRTRPVPHARSLRR